MDRVGASEDSTLLHQAGSFELRFRLQALGKRRNLRGVLGGNDSLERSDDRMLRGDGKKGYAVKRVEPGRKDVDVRIESFDAKSECGAFTAADPVALHRPRAFGPAGELIEALQQAVGIGRNAQEPLRQVAPFDEMLATPAAPIDDLLVGEHGLVVRTPIDLSLIHIFTREAYSREEQSVGFWPGGPGAEAAFYAYAYPEPPGFAQAPVALPGLWTDQLREFLLPYESVRTSSDRDRTVLDFFNSTYEAAANLAKWDRASLERPD